MFFTMRDMAIHNVLGRIKLTAFFFFLSGMTNDIAKGVVGGVNCSFEGPLIYSVNSDHYGRIQLIKSQVKPCSLFMTEVLPLGKQCS